MPDALIQDLLTLATRLATEAGDIARERFGHTRSQMKADASLVTDADQAIQARILSTIAECCPDHGVVAEEMISHPQVHADRTTARYCWVIDPLDGTRNYAQGFPIFSTSIAVLDRGRPVVAVVAGHSLGQLYTATIGTGATLNGQPIQAHDPEVGRDLLLAIPTSKDPLAVYVAHAWTAQRGFIVRNLGSTALHLAMVASGALNGAFSKRCKIWDLAAGLLLVTEAGGCITDATGRDLLPFSLTADSATDLPFLAAAPATHERLLQTIRPAGS
ncbi:MAG: inositol monophosphatase [Planctomycetes bacterium]|nr:inositol monophosphatase [Planctomycetota bacterium]